MGQMLSSIKEGEVDIGPYRVSLTTDIGNGTFGTVYKAVHQRKKKDVAVKKIPFTFEEEVNREAKDMAMSEAKQMQEIRHPNIVSLLDLHLHLGSDWLFMDYCELGDLSRYLNNNADLSLTEKFALIEQITGAVLHLHSRNAPIIHRDIKPGNVLMTRFQGGDKAKLTDFGFAKIYDMNLSRTGSTIYKQLHESLKGTPSYMTPEFYLEEETGLRYTATVDVFSLGLMNAIILEYSPENKTTRPLSGELILA